MATQCCLLGAAPEDIPRLTAALSVAGERVEITVVLFDPVMLGMLAPEIVIVDIDSMKLERLQALRQLRFVLPDCTIVAYAKNLTGLQLRDFHNAGANAIISKWSSELEIAAGLRRTIASGCFTDPRFGSEA